MISNRQGIVRISEEVYEGSVIDHGLAELRIKVYAIDKDPFSGIYTIKFTSDYCDPLEAGEKLASYMMEMSHGGWKLNRMSHE
jgi:hypothetical protein